MVTKNQNIIDRYNGIIINSYKQPFLEVHEPKLVEKDFKVGYIYRFFIRKRNEPNGIIYEIDVFTERKYQDDPLFITSKIRWKIVGEKAVVESANYQSVMLGKKTISNLDTYINNYSKFWKG
jgi:hypothetical protein